jgi:hypothetical protein
MAITTAHPEKSNISSLEKSQNLSTAVGVTHERISIEMLRNCLSVKNET